MNNEKLLEFNYNSPTPAHATVNTVDVLVENGYVQLKESDKWKFEKGNKYFITKNSSAVIAFEIGTGDLATEGFSIVGAHTDAPTFKVKPNNEIKSEQKYKKLNTEMYGGAIAYTWFDRPLAIAGKVYTKGDGVAVEHLLNINKPLFVIPSVAIHQNRTVNDKFEVNKQVDTLPLGGFISNKLEEENFLIGIIAQQLNVSIDDILDFEVMFYEYDKPTLVGYKQDIISAPRLDDLWMVFSGLYGLVSSKPSKCTKVLFCADNEEIGSKTPQGADSNVLENVLKRICLSLGLDSEDYFRAIVNSKAVSADLAHAKHPNHPEKTDITTGCYPNDGIVIKYSGNQKYGTTSLVASNTIALCEKYGIPHQKYIDRSDVVGGSTIGPMLASRLTIPTVDVGLALIGMHSVRETGGAHDTKHAIDFFRAYYEN